MRGFYPGPRIQLLALLMLGVASAAHAQAVRYVDHAATGANDGSSWADAFTSLQDALSAAARGSGDEIWVAAGTYRPDQGQDVTEGDREASFHLNNGVALYGGFAGTETARDERDWETNVTVFSGDLAGNDNDNVEVDEPTRSENSYHVVTASGVDSTARVDGFTIMAGHADGPTGGGRLIVGGGMINDKGSPKLGNLIFTANLARVGGGLYSDGSATLDNVIFSGNVAQNSGKGGGMYTEGGPATVMTLREVTFRSNHADRGGGLFSQSDLTMINTTFIDNTAGLGGGFVNRITATLINIRFLGNTSTGCGGGMLNDKVSRAVLVNVVFSGNQALVPSDVQDGGGGFCNFEAGATLTNVVFSGNRSTDDGGAIYNVRSPLMITNSILWGNDASNLGNQIYIEGDSTHSIAHSIIEDGVPEELTDGGNNFDVDPLFVDADGADDVCGTEDDDLRLSVGSPAIDAGDNNALPADLLDFDDDGDTSERLSIDLDGNVRSYNGGSGTTVVDMGAYEFGAPPVRVAIETPEAEIPETLAASLEAYPNPFRGRVTLQFSLRHTAPVKILLYDTLGRLVETLYAGTPPASQAQTLEISGGNLPSGVYFVRLVGKGIDVTQPVLLAK